MRESRSYEIQLSRAAARQLRSLNFQDQARARRRLQSLAVRAGRSPDQAPQSAAVHVIRTVEGDLLEARSGYVRVLCELLERERVVLVLGILHGRETTRRALAG